LDAYEKLTSEFAAQSNYYHMGLTFYYEGKLLNTNQIDELKKEVLDICISLDWPYQLWPLEALKKLEPNNQTHPNIHDLRGISVTPENCDTLFLTFLPDGRLFSPVYFTYSKGKKPEESDYYLFVKTQFAGADTHLALMKLLIHLEQKYFAKLEVQDDGRYWETRDEKALRQSFHVYEELFEKVTAALSGIESDPDETPESIAGKIERRLKERFDEQSSKGAD